MVVLFTGQCSGPAERTEEHQHVSGDTAGEQLHKQYGDTKKPEIHLRV